MPPKSILNIKPSARFLASIAPNTQPVASASSSSSSTNNQTAPRNSRLKKPALTLDQVSNHKSISELV